MSITFSREQEKILDRARNTYGSRNQLAVVAEECNELSIAVLKFMRYEDENRGIHKTRKNVLEERADVEIVLNHVDAIYGFFPEEIETVIEDKIERLKRWLNRTNDMEYTTIDRGLGSTNTCVGCFYNDHFEEMIETGACGTCKNGSNKLGNRQEI